MSQKMIVFVDIKLGKYIQICDVQDIGIPDPT